MAFGDFTVTRASTKLRIGSNGLYGSVANNVPAFEFNANGSYRGLLVEPGATNLVTYSQEFNDAAWTKTRATVTANATTAPDGTTTADKLVEDSTASDTHFMVNLRTLTATTTYTYSFFAKASERTKISVTRSSNRIDFFTAHDYDLSAGTVTGGDGRIQSVGSGWFRCSGTFVQNTSGSDGAVIRLADATGQTSYTGDGTSGIFIWQAQLETGSVATSPIVTTAGTASRVADVVSLTGASSLIGQTEGTLYVEALPRLSTGTVSRCVFEVSDATTSNLVQLEYQAFGSPLRYRLVSEVRQGGVSLYQFLESNTGGLTTETVIKLALAYKNSDYNTFANGVAVTGTPTGSGTLTNLNVSRVDIGQRRTDTVQFNGWIRSVALFPTRLSNAQLVTLTTP
jgi:hypothetical protein